jgi:pimeloyl-ACP methyl ester carboxylesterase
VPGDEIIVEQLRLIMEAGGATREAAEKQAATERDILTLVKQEKDPQILEKKLRDKLAGILPEAQIGTAIQQVNTPWERYFITYDPATALRKVTCPTLAIAGEKDLQVPPKQNLPAIRKALEAAGNQHFEVDELPGLNHLFQHAPTGLPTEYGGIQETFAPEALTFVSDWILKHTAP